MTAQQHERIIIKGRNCGMASLPLTEYIRGRSDIPDLIPPHTACWRGYQGTWEIKGDKLFLIDLICYSKLAPLNELIENDLSFLFPGQREVFANWFTGEIRIPDGEIISYVHAGFESTYEEDLFITFKRGILVDYSTKDNKVERNNQKTKKRYFHKIRLLMNRLNLLRYL